MLRAYTSVLALTLAILLAAADDSYSQHNPPRIQQPVKAPSAQATQPPTSDQRGTDQIPLTVKVIPSETAKEKADREERERRNKDEKAAVDKRLADETQRLADETENLATYTHWLAGSTLLLFCAAVGQIALFVWQLRLIGKTADAANKSIELASAESIASHPPKLAVRYIHLTSGDPESDVENIEVGFTIENIGGSHATVTQSMIGLYIYTATLPCPPEYYIRAQGP